MSKQQDDLTVSTFDDLSEVAHTHDHQRKLSDYKSTNMPLSANEIQHDEAKDGSQHGSGWTPRTTENIGDMKPLPEPPDAT